MPHVITDPTPDDEMKWVQEKIDEVERDIHHFEEKASQSDDDMDKARSTLAVLKAIRDRIEKR